MAQRSQAVAENVPGPFFVDTTCIDCDTCRQIAPATFGDTGDLSFIQRQPQSDAERRAALRALVACPVGSIGADDRTGIREAIADFPQPVADGVFYCGFPSPKSFGGSSYFVEHLAARFAARGGIRYIFLTHRDDVADAARYAERFGATRIIHRWELGAQPDAERVLEGANPVELAPGFLAIPTPGHTRGHCCLLYRDHFLFTGDHLWWSRERGRLSASQNVCWYSWPEQVQSVRKLLPYRFEWVLPGHGERANFAAAEMRVRMAELARAIE